MKLHMSDVGTYRIVKHSEFSTEQLNVLKLASRERVIERLWVLLGDGKLSLSQVQARYGQLMHQVGRA